MRLPNAGIRGNVMKNNLIRLSKADSLPLCKSTLYKWKHLGKFPQLFVKLGGALFVDLNALDEIIEAGRLGARRNHYHTSRRAGL
jgi:hypothetical protein